MRLQDAHSSYLYNYKLYCKHIVLLGIFRGEETSRGVSPQTVSSLHTCTARCLLVLFFSCWSKQQLVTLLWLIVSLFCPVLSFQRPWASSWPAAVPHPDTASNKSCQECVSTAVTQTCVTTPPHGVHEQSTVSVLCSASCCWGCGCDTFLVESNIKGIELQTEHFERGNSL